MKHGQHHLERRLLSRPMLGHLQHSDLTLLATGGMESRCHPLGTRLSRPTMGHPPVPTKRHPPRPRANGTAARPPGRDMILHRDSAARRSPSVASVDSTLVIEEMEPEVPEAQTPPPDHSDNQGRGRSRQRRQEYEDSHIPSHSPDERHWDNRPSNGSRHSDRDYINYSDHYHPDYSHPASGTDPYWHSTSMDEPSLSKRISRRRRSVTSQYQSGSTRHDRRYSTATTVHIEFSGSTTYINLNPKL
jgi:hypothetical protein